MTSPTPAPARRPGAPRLPPRFYLMKAIGAVVLIGLLATAATIMAWEWHEQEPALLGGLFRALGVAALLGVIANTIAAHLAIRLQRKTGIRASRVYMVLTLAALAGTLIGLRAEGALAAVTGVAPALVPRAPYTVILAIGFVCGSIALEGRRALRQARAGA